MNPPRPPGRVRRGRTRWSAGSEGRCGPRSLRSRGMSSGPSCRRTSPWTNKVRLQLPHGAHGTAAHLREPEALVEGECRIVPDRHIEAEAVVRQIREGVHRLHDEGAPEPLSATVLPHPKFGEEGRT